MNEKTTKFIKEFDDDFRIQVLPVFAHSGKLVYNDALDTIMYQFTVRTDCYSTECLLEGFYLSPEFEDIKNTAKYLEDYLDLGYEEILSRLMKVVK